MSTDPSATVTCPNGHVSADPEWCDTCGARLGAASAASAPSTPAPSVPVDPSGGQVAPVSCPHCGAMNSADNLFCESCGYDFTTGQVPEPTPTPDPPPATAAAVAPEAAVAAPAPEPAAASPWIVVVEVDPAWFALRGELADQPCPPPATSTVTLAKAVSLVGRTSQSRGLRPEVALDGDTAVSRRHAQFVIDGQQMSVIDLSSTNGTYVLRAGEEPTDASQPIVPGVPAVVADGDRVYVGAWTRLTVRAG